jgi:hypothetical protein
LVFLGCGLWASVSYALHPSLAELAPALGWFLLAELAIIGSRLAQPEPVSLAGESEAEARRRRRLEVAALVIKGYAAGATTAARALEYDLHRELEAERAAVAAAAPPKVRYWFRDLDKSAEQSTENPSDLFKPGRIFLRSENIPEAGQ